MRKIKAIKDYEIRTIDADFRAVDNEDEPSIQGYFAVFDSETELWHNMFESIDRDAFVSTMDDDIRALVNHDTTLVLGRNKAGTLELSTDAHGLYGKIKINTDDTDAMNVYHRVKRGDVSQCSFGFSILEEDIDWRDDDTVHTKLERVKLYEVSVCTFPAYEDTTVSARMAQIEEHRKRAIEAWRNRKREVLNKWH